MQYSLFSFFSDNYDDDEVVAYGLKAATMTVNDLKQLDTEQFDQYMSTSTFYPGSQRCKNNVHLIKFLTADLDLWHDDDSLFKDKTLEQVIDELERTVFGESLPYPTYIISTGRGLLLLWRITGNREHTKDISAKAFSQWKKAQKYIYDTLKDYAADPACVTDSSRVFRVPGSYNRHNRKEVYIHTANPENRYNLYDIINDWVGNEPSSKQKNLINKMNSAGIGVPQWALSNAIKAREFIDQHKEEYYLITKGEPSSKQRRFAEKISRINNVPLPEGYDTDWRICAGYIREQIQSGIGPITTAGKFKHPDSGMYITVMRIIEAIIDQGDAIEGRREVLLWIYRTACFALYQDHNEAEQSVVELNNKMDNPLTGNWLAQTMSAEKHNKEYRGFIGLKLSECMCLPWNELKQKYYSRKEYTKEEKAEYDHQRYINKVEREGRTLREEAHQAKLNQVIKLVKEGKTTKQIADIMSISERYVRRLKQEEELDSTLIGNNYVSTSSQPQESEELKEKTELEELVQAGENVHVDGIAGSGKTYLIDRFVSSLPEEQRSRVMRLALTGNAASLIEGGQTIHSALQLPPRCFRPDEILGECRPLDDIDILIIDEVGMVRFDLFQQVMRLVEDQLIRKKHKIIVALVGDMKQTEPVCTAEEQAELKSYWGVIESLHIDGSPYYARMNFHKLTMNEPVRYTDAESKEIASKLRNQDPEVLTSLNENVKPEMRFDPSCFHLCAKVDEANLVNKMIMDEKMKKKEVAATARTYTYQMVDGVGVQEQKAYKEALNMLLYVGLEVCVTTNSDKHKNGQRGTIEKLNKTTVWIRFKNGSRLILKQEIIHATSGDGVIRQFPIVPAYALTIHKAQGMTIEGDVVIHPPMFEENMLYTAVTRARDLRHVYFTQALTHRDLGVSSTENMTSKPAKIAWNNFITREYTEKFYGDLEDILTRRA